MPWFQAKLVNGLESKKPYQGTAFHIVDTGTFTPTVVNCKGTFFSLAQIDDGVMVTQLRLRMSDGQCASGFEKGLDDHLAHAVHCRFVERWRIVIDPLLQHPDHV